GFKSLKTIPLGKWKYIAATALTGTFLPVYLFSIAQTEINSSVSAILNSLVPLNTLVIGALVLGLQFQRRQGFGVVIGLIGSLLLVANGAVVNPGQVYYFALFVVLATICYATNVNLIKKYLSDLTPLSITVGNFVVMLVPALIVLFCSGFSDVMVKPEAQ